jgi:hypothetical protein
MGDDMTLMKDDRDLRGEKKFGGSTTSDRTYTFAINWIPVLSSHYHYR